MATCGSDTLPKDDVGGKCTGNGLFLISNRMRIFQRIINICRATLARLELELHLSIPKSEGEGEDDLEQQNIMVVPTCT